MTISAPPSASAPSWQGLKQPAAPPKGKVAELHQFPCSATAAAKLFRLVFSGDTPGETYRQAALTLGVSPDTVERIDRKETRRVQWEFVYRMMIVASRQGQRAEALKILGWATDD